MTAPLDAASTPAGVAGQVPARRYWIERLGCAKNDVDGDKVEGMLVAEGLVAAGSVDEADLVVVNTCAFIESARQESIDAILSLSAVVPDAELVVTGCMAARYGDELAAALPEVDRIVDVGGRMVEGPTTGGRRTIPVASAELPVLDLLNLPRPRSARPWAYVKIAEGCDRACGFCAIPSFRGPQRSRSIGSVLAEVEQLDVREIVLVAQDLAAYGRDQGVGERAIVPLVREVQQRVDRVRLLYLYPSDLTDGLIDVMCDGGVPYFDLSLQHVSPPLLRRMRRWGNGERFLRRIADIRRREPGATFRSNFIVGYPGETESDHDALLAFVEEAQLDWCGFFSYSREDGTYADTLDGHVDPGLVDERLAELREVQDDITVARRDELVGATVQVLVDDVGIGRSYREAPEIDGIIEVPDDLGVGELWSVVITGAAGPDLVSAVAAVAGRSANVIVGRR